MTLLKRIGLALPVIRKTQACEACGESFACELSLAKGCWCTEVKLSDNTRQELRAKYTNCLCRACLEKAEAGNTARLQRENVKSER
jgi:hypothetical protein